MACTQIMFDSCQWNGMHTMFDSCKWSGARIDYGQSMPVVEGDRVDKGGYCE